MKKLLSALLAAFMVIFMAACGGSEQKTYSPDYPDAAAFEAAVNIGEKVSGKTVQFVVNNYEPNSKVGVNCWAGEHLNFISESGLDVVAGDTVIGQVTDEPTNLLGSWLIPYKVLDIIKSADAPTEPADKEEAPATKEEAPAAKEEAPAAKEEAPAAKEEAPAAKEEAPAAKEEAPAAKEETPAAKEEAPAAKEETPAAADSMELGNYTVSIKDAVQSTDYEGNPVLIVNFDFTNNSDTTASFMSATHATAYQDGVELEMAFMISDDYDGEAQMKNIQPGITLSVQSAYLLTSTNPVTVEVSELFSFDDVKLTKEFSLS